MASRGKGARAKGASYERKIAKILEERTGVELERTPLSGGFAKANSSTALKGDINTIDPLIDLHLHIECKNQKKWALKKWYEQARSDCPKGKKPIVVFHEDRGKDYVMIELWDFLQLVPTDEIVEIKEEI
jgi:hypothetical protein